jgi:hypothetical protein
LSSSAYHHWQCLGKTLGLPALTSFCFIVH